MRGKACARPPGRRAYAGGQARICTGLQRGTPMQDRRHRCTEGIHTRGSRRVRSTDKGAWDRPGATAQARKEHAHAGQAAAKVHTTRREERPAAGQKAFPPAARASLSGRCFVRRQNAPPPGPSFPAMRCKAVPHAPGRRGACCRAARARFCPIFTIFTPF